MKILALEFSSPQRSVAVAEKLPDGATRHLAEAMETGGRGLQGLRLAQTALDAAGLRPSQISCLAVGLGPGSYTGIRAAISLAQGWQLALEIKLLGIGTVECLAAQAVRDIGNGRVNIVIDAQRNEFYLAVYELCDGLSRVVEPLRLAGLAEVQKRAAAQEILIGPEVDRWFKTGQIVIPQARVIAGLAAQRGDYVSGEQLEPVYLREPAFVKAPAPRIII